MWSLCQGNRNIQGKPGRYNKIVHQPECQGSDKVSFVSVAWLTNSSDVYSQLALAKRVAPRRA
jgi:hypothetical protein